MIKKEGGLWAVEKLYAEGRFETILVSTPQEALDHVRYHNLEEVNPDNVEQSLRKGRYAGAFIAGSRKALEDNLITVRLLLAV
jgi:hypothetical protein